MAFREVTVVQVKQVLRGWLRGEGERTAAKRAGVARMTARNYITVAVELGLDRCGGEGQLSDELVGQICERVRPRRPDGHGEAWRELLGVEDEVKQWVKDGLTVVKIGVLLRRKGVEVPHRTLARFAVERCGAGRRRGTVRVDDPPPASELQVDFGRLGLVPDGERRRVCWALIFTACYSRHQFVWPTFSQRLEDVLAGFEAAWAFFGGVFAVVIPDQMKTAIEKADNISPRFNDTFLEYAESRGFAIDPARIRKPTDKPRVERAVPYVRQNFFAGEHFRDVDDVRTRAEVWCREDAGMRLHGTTQLRPLEVFLAEEQPLLLPRPGEPFDTPKWSAPKVHQDYHCEVGRAIYSLPYRLLGEHLKARADSKTVKFYYHGELVKVHPRKAPGGRSTDPADMPPGKDIYATRSVEKLQAKAEAYGPHIGTYARGLLDSPLPWARMRQVYRLVGLVAKWGAERVDQACQRALEAEAVDVNLVSRMLERAKEAAEATREPVPVLVQGRFARDASEFSVAKAARR